MKEAIKEGRVRLLLVVVTDDGLGRTGRESGKG